MLSTHPSDERNPAAGIRESGIRNPESAEQKLRRALAIGMAAAALAGLTVCAKKMLPPSPDRFPPHLQEIRARTRTQVELLFDEDIDPTRIDTDSIVLTSQSGESIVLRGASLGRRGDRVQLWTPVQHAGVYDVRGVVWDLAGNKGRFRARFLGSDRSDTIPPRVSRVEPSPGATGRRRGVTVRVRFSEAVDTSASLDYMFLPEEVESLFKKTWEPDWQGVRFTLTDSLLPGTILYFLLQPRLRDLDGNRLRSPAFTYFTPDSVFDAGSVRGRATWNAGPLGTGTVLFHGDGPADSMPSHTVGLAPVLADGSFASKLRAGTYQVVVIADTNHDGLSDLASVPVRFNTSSESLTVVLEPESLPRPVDAYRR